MPDFFFGYGSLVNLQTHSHTNPQSAVLRGWRRTWVTTGARDLAYLSVRPDPSTDIAGVTAMVAPCDWTALDLREDAYDRIDVTGQIGPDAPGETVVYSVPSTAQNIGHGILLSYLDVVVQGYLAMFGADGAEAFFTSTDGWHLPIVNDRDAPQYPRHQRLTPAETAFVDTKLTSLSAKVQSLHDGDVRPERVGRGWL